MIILSKNLITSVFTYFPTIKKDTCVKKKLKVTSLGGKGVGKEKLDQFCSNLMSDKQKCTSLGSRFTILESINRILVIFGSSQEPRLIV